MNEAALLSARFHLELIGLPQLEEAIDRVMAGPERRSRLISEREKRVIAYHEGGHALVAHALPNTDPVHKISIIPRGRALGYTLTLPTEDKFLVTRSELTDELAMLLGGRTAEELIFAEPTTGAQNDIDRATTIARQMVTEFGMSDSLGPMRFGHPQGEVFLGRDFTSTPDYSEEVAASIDGEVRMLIDARAHGGSRRCSTTTARSSTTWRRSSSATRRSMPNACRSSSPTFACGTPTAHGAQRASMRPDGSPPAPSRNPAAAATQSDSTRRPGGHA